MSLVSLVIVLIVVGVLLWLVEQYIPMDPTIKRIIVVVVIIIVVIWLLGALGLLDSVNAIRIGK